jgi:hypothetical protein
MTKQEFQNELDRILARLDEIYEQDKDIIQPVQLAAGSSPVPISLERMKAMLTDSMREENCAMN